MKPKYDIGQRVTFRSDAGDRTGIVQSITTSVQGTYVYKVRFPGGAEYSYAEWELRAVEKVKP